MGFFPPGEKFSFSRSARKTGQIAEAQSGDRSIPGRHRPFLAIDLLPIRLFKGARTAPGIELASMVSMGSRGDYSG